MKKSYSLIIFDFDGTLADSVGWAMTVISDVADKYRFNTISEEDLEPIRYTDYFRIIIQQVVRKSGSMRNPNPEAYGEFDHRIMRAIWLMNKNRP